MNEITQNFHALGQTAVVLINQSVEMKAEEVEQAVISTCPNTVVRLVLSDIAKGLLRFDLDGVTIALIYRDEPMSQGGWEGAVKRATYRWEDAPNVFAAHTGHFIVAARNKHGSQPPTARDTESQLLTARFVTAVTGAVLRCYPACNGVLWNNLVARPRSLFLEAADAAFAPFPKFPYRVWIDVQIFGDKDNAGFVALTFGLRRFLGREIEFFEVSHKFLQGHAYGLTAYLLQNGANIKSGDIIEKSARWLKKVVLAESQRFSGIPVYLAHREDQAANKKRLRKDDPKYFFFAPSVLNTLYDEKVLNEAAMLPGGGGFSECYQPFRRGFPPFVEAPRLQLDKRRIAAKRDFDVFKAVWFVSVRAKEIFEALDPTAFEFCRCDTELADGSPAPEYWLCKVLPALDAVDEDNSWLTIRTEPTGYRYYSLAGESRLLLKPQTISGHHIFSLTYCQTAIICDEFFKIACKVEELVGLSFRRTDD